MYLAHGKMTLMPVSVKEKTETVVSAYSKK